VKVSLNVSQGKYPGHVLTAEEIVSGVWTIIDISIKDRGGGEGEASGSKKVSSHHNIQVQV
jgi:hypothetical protein